MATSHVDGRLAAAGGGPATDDGGRSTVVHQYGYSFKE
jgi:hypothetical protein